jgi:hypothetical protein
MRECLRKLGDGNTLRQALCEKIRGARHFFPLVPNGPLGARLHPTERPLQRCRAQGKRPGSPRKVDGDYGSRELCARSLARVGRIRSRPRRGGLRPDARRRAPQRLPRHPSTSHSDHRDPRQEGLPRLRQRTELGDLSSTESVESSAARLASSWRGNDDGDNFGDSVRLIVVRGSE